MEFWVNSTLFPVNVSAQFDFSPLKSSLVHNFPHGFPNQGKFPLFLARQDFSLGFSLKNLGFSLTNPFFDPVALTMKYFLFKYCIFYLNLFYLQHRSHGIQTKDKTSLPTFSSPNPATLPTQDSTLTSDLEKNLLIFHQFSTLLQEKQPELAFPTWTHSSRSIFSSSWQF